MAFNKNITTKQLENIVFDGGLVYRDYGEVSETLLGPLKEGTTFEVEQERYEITRDGANAPEKGLVKIVEERAKATIGIMDLTLENLRMGLASTNVEVDGNGDVTKIIGGAKNGDIDDSEYMKNITIIGETLNGNWKVIKIFNALGGEGLTIETTTKEETVVEINVQGHKNPQDTTEPLYEIEDVDAPDTYVVTFTVTSDGSTGYVEDALVYFNDKLKLTNSSGVASFRAIPDGTYAYTVAKDGQVTASDNAVVSGADLAVAVTIANHP